MNEPATNRQRFIMDNSDAWFAESDRQKEEKRIAEELRLEKIADREARQADARQTKLIFSLILRVRPQLTLRLRN